MSQKSQTCPATGGVEGQRSGDSQDTMRQKLKVLTGDLRPRLWRGKPATSSRRSVTSSLHPSTCDLRPATGKNGRGFTLIELVVTIVIMGIMAVVTVQYLVNAARVYAFLLTQRQADSELMDAVDRLRREVRTARSTSVATPSEWTFVNAQGETKTNQLSGSEVTLNGNTLARGVEQFVFAYFDNTNGPTTNCAAIDHVALAFKVTNGQAVSEMTVHFYLQGGFLK